MPDIFEMKICAEVDKLPEVLSFLEQHLEEVDCPMKAQMQITLAAEEIFVNIACYAYAPETGMVTVQLKLEGEPKTASVVFKDRGVPFNPLESSEPDVSLSAEEREIGGLGIYMTKKAMDDVRYEYKDGQNNLTLIKQWDQPAEYRS